MHDRIDTLLIDLGGVLVGADHSRCIAAFAALSGHREDAVRAAIYGGDLVASFELGRCDAAEFRRGLRAALGKDLIDEALDAAWCATLFPVEGAGELLERLSADYTLYLASNTNPIHLEAILEEHPGWARLFSGFHLSYEVGMSKPDPEYFEHLVWRFGLERRRCLFLDDSEENVRAAESVGVRAAVVPPPGLRDDLLAEWIH